jgi:glycosyltransferase involved in cell wall biosynthesis
VGGIAEIITPQDLAKAAENYVFDSDLREKHAKAARETVLNYSWETEVKKLAVIIESI